MIGPSKSLRGKYLDYVSSVWNRYDIMIYSLFIASFVMKNFAYTFEYSRIVFAINCGLFYGRIFRFYHASEAMGPKLVIFHRMASFEICVS